MNVAGLNLVKPPANRQSEEEKMDGSAEVPPILDDPMPLIVASINDYMPLVEEVRSKTSDPICMELATECDRLRVLIFYAENRKELEPLKMASIVARRLSALKLLAYRLDEVKGKEEVEIELSTISSVMTMVRDVLRETGVSHETREIVFQKLLSKLSVKSEAAAG
jgi:hypothetical protein